MTASTHPRLDDLAYFQKVAERGSFSAASRDLEVPKSTLSKRIAQLEADLNVRLLERTTRKLRLTQIGREVAVHSKDMVDAFNAARRVAETAHDQPNGLIRIGCPPGLLEGLLHETVLSFLKRYPGVRVNLLVSASPVHLIDDDIDIALRARLKVEAGASYVVKKLAEECGILVAAPELLRAHPTINCLADLQGVVAEVSV